MLRYALTLTAVALAVTACSPAPDTTTAPEPATSALAPAQTWDAATLRACKFADQHVGGDSTGPEAARKARGAASVSDVPALREIAKENSNAPFKSPRDDAYAIAAGNLIATWCLDHDLAKIPG